MNLKNKVYRVYTLANIFILSSCFLGCKKQVQVDPPYNRTTSGNVFNDDATATSALTGMYVTMVKGLSGTFGITVYTGLSSDELSLFNGVSDLGLNAFYSNALISNAASDYGSSIWKAVYTYIYYSNAAIEGLTASSSLTPSIKRQLLGEAKFLRGFCYFYLVNLYGDASLALSTDYKLNAQLGRVPKSQVYDQIIADLKEAHDLLSSDYLDGNLIKYPTAALSERVRPTSWAAAALLARTYLYKSNDFANAEIEANEVINNSSMFSLDSLNGAFLKNGKEAIWQLQPVNSGRNTDDATTFILTSGGPTTSTDRPVYLSDTLLKSFESGDQRKIKWINNVVATGSGIKYYYPFKYKNNTATVTEYLMVLRLGEQYLIRAEARAQLGNTSGALADLNMIRHRAGLNDYSGTTDKNSLLTAILHERQVELFAEWGHRWLDLKRTANVDALMIGITPIKSGGTVQWSSYKQLYPIPFLDIQKDPNLVQNSGY